MLQGLAVAFGVVFVAELGDKSQLLAMTLAARYRPWAVLAGIAAATLVLQGLAVLVGSFVGDRLPTRPIQVVAGLAFLAFAVWTLLDRDDDDADGADADGDDAGEPGGVEHDAAPERRSGLLTAGTAFFVSEFGDKTMLATVTLATQQGALGTWLGASAGMVAADALAVVVGAVAGARLPRRVVRWVAAATFALFGLVMVATALLGG